MRRRGGGGRQAGEEDGDGEHGDDGRVSHLARPGGPADSAKGKLRYGGKNGGFLLCSKTLSAPCPAKQSWFRPSGFGGSNEDQDTSQGRRIAIHPCHGHVPAGHVAGIGLSDHAPPGSPAAPSRRAPYVGPGSGDERGIAGPGCSDREGFLALAPCGLRVAPLTSPTAGGGCGL